MRDERGRSGGADDGGGRRTTSNKGHVCLCSYTPFWRIGNPINRGPNNRTFTFSDPSSILKPPTLISLGSFWVYQGH